MKFGSFSLLQRILGYANIPTSTHDSKLAQYMPKITDADFNYDPFETPIAQNYINELRATENTSGATIIKDGPAAFIIRAAFARMATKTIDLQTYIYSNDFSSRVLIGELKNAADRGVKVRILLDDYGTKTDFADVLVLNQHPNIEVKIFNAAKNRSRLFYYPQMLMDFNRLNSRMHNKLFIVDNIALVTGGRNVGRDYFFPETASNFSDTDVLFIGNIAQHATASFNEYWNYHLAIPASVFPKAKSKHAKQKLEYALEKLVRTSSREVRRYNTIISLAQHDFKMKKFDFCWGYGQFLADPPSKVEMTMRQKENYRGKIIIAVNKFWRQTMRSAYVSAAYFVPGRGGVDTMLKEEKSGVHVTIVTNSLSSTNAPTVYAKWEKYRTKLLTGGIDIYEFMLGERNPRKNVHDRERKRSCFSVMHSKTIVFDDHISWIGSFNLDPRSAYYNTENVAIFESAEFAEKLRNLIMTDATDSWKLRYAGGRTIWTGKHTPDEPPETHYRCPDTSIFRRALKTLAKFIPEKFV